MSFPEGRGIAMVPHFFLNLHECGRIITDEEGFDFDSEEEARDEAMRSARDIMGAEILDGSLCLGCHIEVADAMRRPLFILPFRDAVRISYD